MYHYEANTSFWLFPLPFAGGSSLFPPSLPSPPARELTPPLLPVSLRSRSNLSRSRTRHLPHRPNPHPPRSSQRPNVSPSSRTMASRLPPSRSSIPLRRFLRRDHQEEEGWKLFRVLQQDAVEVLGGRNGKHGVVLGSGKGGDEGRCERLDREVGLECASGSCLGSGVVLLVLVSVFSSCCWCEEETRKSRGRRKSRSCSEVASSHPSSFLSISRPISIAILAPIYSHKSMSAEDGHLWAAEVRLLLSRGSLRLTSSTLNSSLWFCSLKDLKIRLHFHHRSVPKLSRRPSGPRSSLELHCCSTGGVGSRAGGGDPGRKDSFDHWCLNGLSF